MRTIKAIAAAALSLGLVSVASAQGGGSDVGVNSATGGVNNGTGGSAYVGVNSATGGVNNPTGGNEANGQPLAPGASINPITGAALGAPQTEGVGYHVAPIVFTRRTIGPLAAGESINPITGAVVGQPLQPGDIGYKGHQ
jgi:hypothetical protein